MTERVRDLFFWGGREEERKRVGETKGPLLSVVRRKTEMPFFYDFFYEKSHVSQTYFDCFFLFCSPTLREYHEQYWDPLIY